MRAAAEQAWAAMHGTRLACLVHSDGLWARPSLVAGVKEVRYCRWHCRRLSASGIEHHHLGRKGLAAGRMGLRCSFGAQRYKLVAAADSLGSWQRCLR